MLFGLYNNIRYKLLYSYEKKTDISATQYTTEQY